MHNDITMIYFTLVQSNTYLKTKYSSYSVGEEKSVAACKPKTLL